ncbi:unnamed protein product, partial [Nesidiocoris tenuis]
MKRGGGVRGSEGGGAKRMKAKTKTRRTDRTMRRCCGLIRVAESRIVNRGDPEGGAIRECGGRGSAARAGRPR